MKNFNGRSVTGSKGSCLLCWVFGNSLENLGKSTGECKNKHFDNFPKFLKIFGNLRKSWEIFGKNWKMLQSAQDDLSALFNCLFLHFQIFKKSSESVGSLRKSSEVFGKNRKMSESSQNDLPTLFENFQKFSEIFWSVWKCSENFGNPREIFECNRRFMKIVYTLPISDTCGLKIRFKNFDL